MLNDNRILEFYIGSVINLVNWLSQIIIKENELLKNSNVLNRKRNSEAIQLGYQQYLKKVCSEWEKIYNNSSEFQATLDKSDLLVTNGTLYAITLNQRHVEQFFFRLYFAIKSYTRVFDDKCLRKMPKSEFLKDFSFSHVKLIMKDLFFVVLMAMRDHKIVATSENKKTFVLINQKILEDVSIQYSVGEEITDSRIDRLLKDIDEGEKRKKAERDEGVKNGSVRVDFGFHETTEQLLAGLGYSSCSLLAGLIGGSTAYYNCLPGLASISKDEMAEVVVEIDTCLRNASLSPEKILELEETAVLFAPTIAKHSESS